MSCQVSGVEVVESDLFTAVDPGVLGKIDVLVSFRVSDHKTSVQASGVTASTILAVTNHLYCVVVTIPTLLAVSFQPC